MLAGEESEFESLLDLNGLENLAKPVIKTEPVDDEPRISEPPKRQKITPHEYVARNPAIRGDGSAIRSQDRVPAIRSDQTASPPINWQNFPQPGPSTSSSSNRDPRIKRTNSQEPRRQAFLQGQLSAENIIQATEKSSSYPDSAIVRNAFQAAREGHERLTLASSSNTPRPFIAVVPRTHLIAGSHEQRRSPLISSDHNALFVSQATRGNVEDAWFGQRYGNIPRDLQAMGNLLDVDLDRVATAERARLPEARRKTTETSFAENCRTIGTQVEGLSKTSVDKETQTTKNTEGFDFFIENVRALTQEQRDALAVFKEVSKEILLL